MPLEILLLLPVYESVIILLFSFALIFKSAKLTTQIRWGYNPISRLRREFRRWTRFNVSRFEFFKTLYDETMPNDFGDYLANIFETKLVITKPALVELVSRKRFSHFFSRPRLGAYSGSDHLTHSIFNLDGEHWDTWRKRLSLAFSNEKLEAMFPQIADCAAKISGNIMFRGRAGDEVDVNDISRTFVMTVFHCCVFGQPIEGVDSDSKFGKMAKQFRHMDTFRFKYFDIFSCALPQWRHIFGGVINATEATEYFKRLITERVQEKENADEKGHDFLSTFMEFEQLENSEETYKWDRKATEAHCVVFLLGGFTATSSTIAFMLFELAKNPDVQEKLKREIDVFLRQGVTISPEIIRKMTYLDHVIKETLRKYPPFSANVRICTKRFEMPENNLTIEKGKTVVTPVSGLHHDPKYYPRPDVFDPERFNSGQSPPPCAYLPFGEGPRKCIGQRFAVLIVKTVIVKLLSQFHWSIIPGKDVLPNFQPRKFTTTVSEVKLRYESRPNIIDSM